MTENILPNSDKEELDEIVSCIKKKAEASGLDLTQNLIAIARAKQRFFGILSWSRCPCDKDSDRSCISSRCKEEIEKNGVCHCNLYKKRGE